MTPVIKFKQFFQYARKPASAFIIEEAGPLRNNMVSVLPGSCPVRQQYACRY
jgi:hypothetical protein